MGKRAKAEEVIAKLREVEVRLSQFTTANRLRHRGSRHGGAATDSQKQSTTTNASRE